MKKSLILFSLSLLALSFSWCKPLIFTWDWMVSSENQIYCENRGWEYQASTWNWAEWCYNPATEILCPISEAKEKICSLWFSLDFINDINKFCSNNSWVALIDGDWNEVCIFNEESFCYADDFYLNDCKPWDKNIMFLKESSENEILFPYAEQACIDSNGQLSENDEWYSICILEDDTSCLINDIINWWCESLTTSLQSIIDMHDEEAAYQQYLAECYDQEQHVVCWKDWNSYYNRCFMEKAGVEEETELAEVVDWECIYW